MDPVNRAVAAGKGNVHHAVFIDDIKQQTSGSETAIVKRICESGGELVGELQRLGFILSGKSCVVSSSKLAIKQIQRFFKTVYQVDIEAPKVAEHLGHARTNDPRSVFRVIRKRFQKAARRTSRIRSLAKRDRRAVKLWKTGAKPMAVYGHSVLGLNGSLQKRLDDMALKACPGVGYRPDPGMVLLTEIGSIPSLDSRAALIREWLATWRTFRTLEQEEIAQTWKNIAESMSEERQPRQSVRWFHLCGDCHCDGG